MTSQYMPYLSEFLGTYVLGLGVFTVGGLITASGKKNNWFLAIGAGLALVVAILVALSLHGNALLNPAFAVNAMIQKQISVQQGLIYIALQILAIFLAYWTYKYLGPYLTHSKPPAAVSSSVGTTA